MWAYVKYVRSMAIIEIEKFDRRFLKAGNNTGSICTNVPNPSLRKLHPRVFLLCDYVFSKCSLTRSDASVKIAVCTCRAWVSRRRLAVAGRRSARWDRESLTARWTGATRTSVVVVVATWNLCRRTDSDNTHNTGCFVESRPISLPTLTTPHTVYNMSILASSY